MLDDQDDANNEMGAGAIKNRIQIYPLSHILVPWGCKSRRILNDDHDEMVSIKHEHDRMVIHAKVDAAFFFLLT
jgi:hypothetical protein